MADKEFPPADQLADDDDELGWDRKAHGRMADFAEDPDTGGVATTDELDPEDGLPEDSEQESDHQHDGHEH